MSSSISCVAVSLMSRQRWMAAGTPSILIVQTNCDLIENWSVWTSRMPILELGAATLVMGFAIIVTSDESDGASKAAEKALEAARRLPHGAARIEVQHAP